MSKDSLIAKLEAIEFDGSDRRGREVFRQAKYAFLHVIRQHFASPEVVGCHSSLSDKTVCLSEPAVNEKQGEISVNANDALTKFISKNGYPGENFADYKAGWFDGFDTASITPVPVSLDEMMEVYKKQGLGVREGVQAVLDAAGVKYVD